MNPAVLGALTGGCFTALGWYVTKHREDAVRRQQERLQRLSDQIHEVYGPLRGLTQQTQIAYETALVILPSQGNDLDFAQFGEREYKMWHFILKSVLLPLNGRIVDIILTKRDLIEPLAMPESFTEFLKHAALSDTVNRLAIEAGELVSPANWRRYPERFNRDVETALDSLLRRHEETLRRLQD